MTGFGDVLRSLRESRSLTQEELADRAGLTVKAVGALERGERRRPYPHTVRSLSTALGLDADERQRLVASVAGRRATAAEGTPAFAVERSLPTNEPAAASALVGRHRELADVLALLGRRRLVTITGPGGVGKTTLARAVAGTLADGGNKVTVVELSAIREPDLVLARVAAALGLPESPTGGGVDALSAALGGRGQVLVLDNLEQVLHVAPVLARLVEATPDVRVVATSRAPLRIRAEHEVRIGPLDLPVTSALADVGSSPAAQLLIDRMAAAGCPIDLDEKTAPLVAEACRRLDGLPLAIELAAARTPVLGLSGLLGSNALSGKGFRDLPERQQTIAAVVAWSHDLLDAEAQDLFAALSVFRGAFTIDAAAALVDDDVLEPLTTLVEQSLVVRLAGGTVPRFRLLQPIREQAASRLAAAGGDRDLLRQRHADWFDSVAALAGPALRDRRLVAALEVLEAADADLRAAVQWMITTGRHGDAGRIMGRIWLYLALRNHGLEGLDTLALLDLSACSPSQAASAHRAAAGLTLLTGDLSRMREHATAAVALTTGVSPATAATEQIDSMDAAEARLLLANAEVFLGSQQAAGPHIDAVGPGEAGPPGSFVEVYRLMILAQMSLSQSDVPEAVRRATTSVERARDLGNDFLLSATLNVLAGALVLTGEAVEPARLLAESVGVCVRAGMGWPLTYSLPGLAGLAVRLGRYDLGVRFFAASASFAARSAADQSFPVSRDQADRDLAELRARLGGDAFRTAWDAGRAAGPGELEGWAHEILRTL